MKHALSSLVPATLALCIACTNETVPTSSSPELQPPSKTAEPSTVLAPSSPDTTGVFPLQYGTFADKDLSELEAFGRAIGEASAVGLGESYHTTGGQYDMKARLMRYLIEKKGFRAVTMETPWMGAQPATDYVEGRGSYTAADAMHSVFTVFWDDSLESFFTWLRRFNQAHPNDPVVFHGFDIQEPELLLPAIASGVRAVSSADADAVVSGLDPCFGSGAHAKEDDQIAHGTLGLSEERYMTCFQGLEFAARWLSEHATSVAALEPRLAASLPIYVQNARYMNDELYVDPYKNARDAGMALCFTALKKAFFPEKKAILWAHNLHLQKARDSMMGEMMGVHLAKSLGEKYVAVGFSSFDVSLYWPWLNVPTPKPNLREDSFERALHTMGNAFAWVDHSVPGPFGPGKRYSYDKGGLVEADVVVGKRFDLTVYVDKSRPTHYVE